MEKKHRVAALTDVSFSVLQGETVALTGRSGAGKTTLLNILAGLLRPDGGEYWYDGEQVSSLRPAGLLQFRREQIALIPQDFALIEDESVERNVDLPLRLRRMPRRGREEAVRDILCKLGISDKAQMPVDVLSGGEKQRVAAARALITNPSTILADEPTAALDEWGVKEVLDLLWTEHASGKTIIVVTHDPVVAERCSRVLRMEDGRIVKDEHADFLA